MQQRVPSLPTHHAPDAVTTERPEDAQYLPAVHGTPALRPEATHRKPIGHRMPTDEAAGQYRPEGHVTPVGATAALEQKAPA